MQRVSLILVAIVCALTCARSVTADVVSPTISTATTIIFQNLILITQPQINK